MKNLATKNIAATLILILFMGCSGSVSIGSAQRKSTQVENVDGPKVGVIKKSQIVDGCAFGLYYSSEEKKDDKRYVFFDDLSNLAWMNIDGQDVRLKLMSSVQTTGETNKIGDKGSSTYKGKEVTVKIDYIVTRVCDQCEYIDCDATIAVTKNGRTQTVKVIGFIGC